MTTPDKSEHMHQRAVIQWANMNRNRWPILNWLYAIPNGAKRTNGAKLVAEGMKSGVSDLCLPAARRGYHGAYVEMKRRDSGKMSAKQKLFMRDVIAEGFCCVCCHGDEEAIAFFKWYLA